ncbi:non-ribosomal peptide synthetase [Serratia microhaemolytica]|uniref:non-ribosomal peptide synthetase n=1 Tax=Serratia microhaemolytica TaxID=2675110 RepID=UPI000FDD951F|nr:non-ribosomal peptide synthetase [Serratia microhaemolytica]
MKEDVTDLALEQAKTIDSQQNISPALRARLMALSLEQRSKLEAVLGKSEHIAISSISKTQSTSPSRAPLSVQQQWLWLLSQLEGNNSTYNIPGGFVLKGTVNQHHLFQALSLMAKRHWMLRTAFGVDASGEVYQYLLEQNYVDYCYHDLSARQVDICSVENLDQVAQPILQLAFDLYQGPLWRAHLLRLREHEHFLVLSFHHIIFDGWSLGVFVRELFEIYQQLGANTLAGEPEARLQYYDYVAWQKAQFTAEQQQRERVFWQRSLVEAPVALALPADCDGHSLAHTEQSSTGRLVSDLLPNEMLLQIKTLAAQESTTPYAVLMAAYMVLLHRYTGVDQLTVGTPVSGRSLADTHGLIGLFINTLPIRTQLAAADTFRDVLRQVRDNSLEAFAHANLPFNQIVEAVSSERSAVNPPLLQSFFAYQNAIADLSVDGVDVSYHHIETGRAKFDFSLEVFESQGGVACQFEYNTGLFSHARIVGLAEHFATLLASALSEPDSTIGYLTLLPDADYQQLLSLAGDVGERTLTTLPALFEAQLKGCADTIALRYGDNTLTYGELNLRANRLAHRLIEQGVAPEQRVALCAERSIELIVAMLAILKAGGVYMPLDPAYPGERLRYILQDAEPLLLLADERGMAALGQHTIPTWLLETALFDSGSDHNPEVPHFIPSNLAYLIYTSGSTGQPKGVMVEHRQIVNLVMATGNTLSTQGVDLARGVMNASIMFDASWDELAVLFHGGELILTASEDKYDANQLVQHLVKQKVNYFSGTPSQLEGVLNAGLAQSLRQKMVVLVGGEPISSAIWHRLQQIDNLRVLNVYGPTEATVDATLAMIEAGDLTEPVIGLPIANSRIYVLDQRQQLVPLGATGEIYIGGAGVARGYFKRADLTAERFLPDPFSVEPGARMYRSGDLGRWRADGQLEYLGRNDEQVKIRGFRIEPGEIAAQLQSHPSVRDAVVVAQGEPSALQLVAYFIAQQESSVTELREYLAARLPDYMVPVAYMPMAELPLTPNGKLDKRALPAPDEQAFARAEYQAPQGQLECTLAAIWCELLGVEQVSRHDNFFALGGHSLLIVTLIERLRLQGLSLAVSKVFTAPTLAAMAAALGDTKHQTHVIPANAIPLNCSAITPEMLPLISLQQAEIDCIAARVAGGMANIQDIYPLAPLQEGILFHYLLDKEDDLYLGYVLLAFEHRQQLDSFLTAFQQVIDRHDILRSAIQWQDLSQPVQVVYRQARLPVMTLEISTQQDAVAQLRAHCDPRHHRLDVTQAPLFSATIAQDPHSGEWLLALLQHHLVQDHLSLEIMLREIRAFMTHQGETLPPALPFREFVAQVHAIPQSVHQAYFQQQLGDLEQPTTPFGLLDVQHDGSTDKEVLVLDPVLTQSVRETARQHGVSAAVLFHVVWAQLLAQCSGQDDVVFGTVLMGRSQGVSGADQVLGLFINTLPIRIKLGERSVGQVVQETYQRLSELLEHEQAPLALAQQCSGIMAPLPLFNSLFNYRYSDGYDAEDWLGIRILDVEERGNYPLALSVDDMTQNFTLTAQSSGGVAAKRLTAYVEIGLRQLLATLGSHPEQPIWQVNILPIDERQHLLELNPTVTPYLEPSLLQQLFEQQVAHFPEAIALRYGDNILTYGELNLRANRLAHRLIEQGVAPEQRVALCAERSIELIVAMLAILKAGGAYVPLDPAYPGERLRYILQDAEPLLLLADERGMAALGQHAIPTWLLETALFDGGNQCDPIIPTLTASNLAYLIYTSGSTGQPKGVMVEHQQIVNFMVASSGMLSDTLAQPVSGLMNISMMFDASWEELALLFCGGELILTAKVSYEPTKIVASLSEERINRFCCTPSQLEGLLNAGLIEQRTTPLLVTVGGEALPPALWQRLQQAKKLFVMNSYGPTETTVVATRALLETDGSSEPVIGRPIANTRVYVLDQRQQLVPLGAMGEIYIGGAGVARGYFKRADLTAERFLPDPFNAEPGARMYRSGDLGRWRADGQLEYLGRNDEQVKIRGFRIEPGEIAAQLQSHPSVRDAVVVAQGESSTLQLVAYFIAQQESLVTELREYLAARLPDYMVPAAYVPITQFPLTPNGKLDKRALPAPDEQAFARAEYQAPEGELEQRLAEIWCELLGVERVGRHDNFFALGGHSLLAVRLCSQVQQRLGVSLTVAALFSHSTLAALATVIAELPQETLPDITRLSRDQHLPLSFAQQRLWFLWQMEGPSATYNIPALFHLHGELRRDALIASLNALYARYEAWRSIFVLNSAGEGEVVLLSPESGVPLCEHDLSTSADTQQALAQLSEQEAHQPFDLSQGPLVRARLVKVAEQQWALLLTQHHIISDGWSIGVICQELAQLYNGYSQGDAVVLPARAIDYPDYAAWQRQWLSGERLKQQADYWYQQLQGAPELLTLPTDFPRPVEQSYHGDAVSFSFDARLSEQIRQFSRQQGITPFMLLLAAWSVVLTRLAGQQEVVIGSPVANRGRSELEGVVGFFANTLALRINVAAMSDAQHLLHQVRDQVIQAQAHQDLPFEQVVERLNPTRQRGYAPLFQALLSWQEREVLPKFDGITVELGESNYQRVKFDLELGLSDGADGLIHGQLGYAQALFSEQSIERHIGYLQRVLTAMVNEANQPLSAIGLLSVQQQQDMLSLGRGNQEPVTATTLPALFAAQLAEHSEAIALRYGDNSLTYGELNLRANRLAHRLIEQGVVPEQRVALCAERSIELIVAMLAILKAGGAYVPLDPAYPGERLRYILQDAEPLLLLADERGMAALGQHAIPTWLLETALFDGGNQCDPIIPTLTASNLAYLIYTSGSTGQPKGVMVEHQQIVNFMVASSGMLSDTLAQPVSGLMNISMMFDASWEELALLFCGGELILTAKVSYEPTKIVASLSEERINRFCCTPSQLEGLLNAGLIEQRTTPLLVTVGGEALPPALWQRLQQAKKLFVMNSYGPTETTVVATRALLETDGSSEPVIGRPIANTRVYVLDQRQQLVPLGAMGEIYIGGAGVARGYFKRADLTAERFLPDPFSTEPGARMYRSGDLGRWRADGQLEYLGRNDEQVKIRGFRIEPGEIAAQLQSHPSVRDAVVVAQGEPSALQLVAYLIAHAEHTVDAAELRNYLAQRLPDYMVPAAYVPMAELPLTPNGKLDKRALPAPDEQAFARAEYQAPQGQLECTLAAIWCELLGVEQVSRHDNFFALGGHSLLVVKLCDLINRRLGKTVPVSQVFSSSTLTALAAALQGEGDNEEGDEQLMELDKQLPAMHFIPAPQVAFEQVLLTGAAGFFGIYLLAEIQQRYPQATVHCLVRGDNGLQRLRQAAARYQLTLDEARLTVLSGDLSQPRLGLSAGQWCDLAEQVDVIYHCGAWVNHLYSYSALRASNVASTRELLGLCCQGRAKQLFYISTLSAAQQQGDRLCEATVAAHCPSANGYVQSKWVCEQLMMQAFAAGLTGAIYRMGNITGSTVHGVSNVEHNHTLSLIKGCVQMGVAPDWGDVMLDISPVDILARLTIAARGQADYLNRALNLGYLSTLSGRDLLLYLISKGHPISFVAPEIWSTEWVAQLDEANALYPFKSLYLAPPDEVTQQSLEVVEKVLVDSELVPFDLNALLETYYRYWRQSGFMPVPNDIQGHGGVTIMEEAVEI